MHSLLTRAAWVFPAALLVSCAGGPAGSDEANGASVGAGPAAALPRPSFHHIHVNSADPERALDWWSTFWPAGERTTVAGMPAFAADGIYLLYTRVEARAPGAFDPEQRQSLPQCQRASRSDGN